LNLCSYAQGYKEHEALAATIFTKNVNITLPGYDESPHSAIAPWTVATWMYLYVSKTNSFKINFKQQKVPLILNHKQG